MSKPLTNTTSNNTRLMDRFDRIYDLHKLLSHSRYPVSREKIQQELECSRATAKRIIDSMRTYLDAPIRYDRTLNGYYYDCKQSDLYELPGLWFNASELHALLSVQQLLDNIQPGLFDKQLAPLKHRIDHLLNAQNSSSENLNQRVRILQIANRSSGEFFQQIAGATMQRKKIQLDYYNRAQDNTQSRLISPQRLIHYRDNWYCDAWCHKRHALRTFSLDAIKKVQVLPTTSKDICDEALDRHFGSAYGIFSGEASQVAILRFNQKISRWISQEQWHPKQKGEQLPNGKYELTLPFNNPTELAMDILRYGGDVEVIQPKSLRENIAQQLKAALSLYH